MSIENLVRAYGIPYVKIDGMDVLQIHERARRQLPRCGPAKRGLLF